MVPYFATAFDLRVRPSVVGGLDQAHAESPFRVLVIEPLFCRLQYISKTGVDSRGLEGTRGE